MLIYLSSAPFSFITIWFDFILCFRKSLSYINILVKKGRDRVRKKEMTDKHKVEIWSLN